MRRSLTMKNRRIKIKKNKNALHISSASEVPDPTLADFFVPKVTANHFFALKFDCPWLRLAQSWSNVFKAAHVVENWAATVLEVVGSNPFLLNIFFWNWKIYTKLKAGMNWTFQNNQLQGIFLIINWGLWQISGNNSFRISWLQMYWSKLYKTIFLVSFIFYL